MNTKRSPAVIAFCMLVVALLLTACGGGGGSDGGGNVDGGSNFGPTPAPAPAPAPEPGTAKEWSKVQRLDNVAGYLGSEISSSIAVDPFGNVIVVWSVTPSGIYSNYYTMGIGWGTAQRINTGSEGARSPHVAFDPAGNAVAVWDQNYTIWSNRFEPGIGWGTAERIETLITAPTAPVIENGPTCAPQIALDPAGNGLAVWNKYDDGKDSSYTSAWSNRYTAGVGWESAQPLEASVQGAGHPSIAIDPAGNAVTVWSQGGRVWSIRYTAGVGWGTKQSIKTVVGIARNPKIAIDPAGNALAVWSQWGQSDDGIWSNRYTAGIGWGTEQRIKTGAGFVEYPQIAVDPVGNALAVWSQGGNGTWSNRYTAGIGWGTEQRIHAGLAWSFEPQIVIGSSGIGVAVWEQREDTASYYFSTFSIQSNHYTPGAGWGTPQRIGSGGGSNSSPKIAVDRSDTATAVWTNGGIQSSRYE